MMGWWRARLLLIGLVLSAVPMYLGSKKVQGIPPAETVERRSGTASWYGGGEPLNRDVAMGHRFDPEALEAAMWDTPFGTKVKVTNIENDRFVVVRVTDRGPARRFPDRVINLTQGAFMALAPLREGLIPVVIQQVP